MCHENTDFRQYKSLYFFNSVSTYEHLVTSCTYRKGVWHILPRGSTAQLSYGDIKLSYVTMICFSKYYTHIKERL